MDVYYNAKVYTSDGTNPTATAFVIDDGRFIYVGDDDGALRYGAGTDMHGQCIIPGLVDSHCHILSGVIQSQCNVIIISEDTRPDELEQCLKNAIRQKGIELHSHSGEIPKFIAMGIKLTNGPFNKHSIGHSFDGAIVGVFSTDGHALLLNQNALDAAGIDKDTTSPSSDSYFAKDSSGEPTGMVIELPAMKLCKNAIFGTKINSSGGDILLSLQSHYNARGYTTVFDAMSLQDDDELLTLLCDLDAEKRLTMRYSLSFGYSTETELPPEQAIKELLSAKSRFASENVTLKTVKMITDGTVEEHSAYLCSPYSDNEECYGSTFLPYETLRDMTELATQNGLSVHVHAIGDKAVQETLTAFDHAKESKDDATLTIAHNQIYDETSFALLQKLAKRKNGIYFQTTPQWVMEDDYAYAYIGERIKNQFPIRTATDCGATVTFGGDTSDDDFYENAFVGMAYATTPSLHASSGSQTVTMAEALAAYTLGGAKQLGIADKVGSIAVGKDADFAVISDDLFATTDVSAISVLQTYFKGKSVYKK